MHLKSLLLPGIAALVVAALALTLGQQSATTSGAKSSAAVVSKAGHVTIAIRNYAYLPASLTVKAGARVTWTNHDQTAHTATATQGALDTGTINAGKSSTIDFKHPGTYMYHCAFHAFMTAAIKVVP